MSEHVIKAVAGAVVGVLLGWSANALTLGGRVEAIEKSVARIESRLFPPPTVAHTQEK